MTVYDRLTAELDAIGCRFGMLKIERVAELKEELQARFEEGQLEESFFNANLRRLESSPPAAMPEARSVIIIAAPLPLIRLGFTSDGVIRRTVIPPYYAFKDKMAAIRKALGRSLGTAGYRIADARIPYKLAAVRCGLARYGQNNLVYVEGMGSFLRLVAFYTDLPAPADEWRRSRLMDECADCGFCRGNCPTNCLNPLGEGDHLLAHAEKCLTLYNEEPEPFPDWIGPHWHNSLIGCMRCQTGCPVDRPLLRDATLSETFTESETALILAATPFDELPATLKEKLARYDLDQYYAMIPRNLKALLEYEH